MRLTAALSASMLILGSLLAPSVQPAYAHDQATSETRTAPKAKPTADDLLLKRLSLRKKIGQMFMIGFKGTEYEEDLHSAIDQVHPGALIVFARNLTSGRQIVSLISSAQQSSLKSTGIPLLVSTDQEGGDVIRVRTAVPLPSELAIGSTGDSSIAEKAGTATGLLLKTLGFNMNLSPVLDVSNPKQLSFIGTRTYGDDPALVGRMGIAFSEGLMKAGVLPTGKHFPGHGGIDLDSHNLTPHKDSTLEELREKDLVPFAAMQKRFPDQWAAMLGNLAFPRIDDTADAATVSGPLVTGVLRNEMGFNGLILTDDIQMGSASNLTAVRERVLRAIDAGADMVMVAWNKALQKDFIDVVENAVRSGRIKVARIDESVRRILLLKHRFAARTKLPPTDEQIRFALHNPDFAQIGVSILANIFQKPLSTDEQEFATFVGEKKILMFSGNQRFALSFREALDDHARFSSYPVDVDRPADIDRVMLAHPDAVGVFYMSGYQAAKVAAKISDDIARRILLVSVETPGVLPNVGAFRLIKSVYFRHPDTGKLIARRYFNPAATVRNPASKVGAR